MAFGSSLSKAITRKVAPAATTAVDPTAQALAQQLAFLQQYAPSAQQQQLQMPYQQPTLVNPELDPTEIQYFDSLANRLNTNFNQNVANNQLQQTQLSSEQDVRMEDLTRRFDQMRGQLPGQYQKRGIMNSGIYQQGMENYATTRANTFADAQRGFGNQMAGLQQAYSQLGQNYTTGLADLGLQKAAKKNAKAAIIRGVR